MNIARRNFLPLFALSLLGVSSPNNSTAQRAQHVAAAPIADDHVYELRTYTAHPGKLPNVLARFRDHTTKLFEKHGMKNIGYFTPLDSVDGAGEKLVYVLEHASRDAAKASWSAFVADPEWKAVAKESEANGPIVAKIESVFMAATDFSPTAFKSSNANRVFELRSYTTVEGKLGDLDARFRDHTLKFFAQHNMTSVAYWHPTDANKGASNTLMYILAHPSRDAAKTNWAAFRTDPAWLVARAASETNGLLTTAVKSVFLAPTDFSALH